MNIKIKINNQREKAEESLPFSKDKVTLSRWFKSAGE